jgi:glyoxylase-like metal-dependent hydrolase (beta-lactamase superfamily II)
MKLFFHFAVTGFSNTYLIGPDNGGSAILVDPGIMDTELLCQIEDNNYYVDTVLVTTPHEAHIYGIKTIMKIYNAAIYSGSRSLYQFECCTVEDYQTIETSTFTIKVFQVMGHTQESMVYLINDHLLFSGDALGAGRVGDSPNRYARNLLLKNLREKILPLEQEIFIFPGHGPPTTLEIEKQFNPALQENPM